MAACSTRIPVAVVGLLLFVSSPVDSSTNAKPQVDPGVFVIQGINTCRNGTGYCVLGHACSVDIEFREDDEGGHCLGLRGGFNPPAPFVCCQYNNGSSGEAPAPPVQVDVNVNEHVDLIQVVEAITDHTGIIELVTKPFTGSKHDLITATMPNVPEQWLYSYFNTQEGAGIVDHSKPTSPVTPTTKSTTSSEVQSSTTAQMTDERSTAKSTPDTTGEASTPSATSVKTTVTTDSSTQGKVPINVETSTEGKTPANFDTSTDDTVSTKKTSQSTGTQGAGSWVQILDVVTDKTGVVNMVTKTYTGDPENKPDMTLSPDLNQTWLESYVQKLEGIPAEKTTTKPEEIHVELANFVTDKTGIIDVVTKPFVGSQEELDNIMQNSSKINESWIASYVDKQKPSSSTVPPEVNEEKVFVDIVDVVTDTTGIVDLVTKIVSEGEVDASMKEKLNVNETWLMAYLEKNQNHKSTEAIKTTTKVPEPATTETAESPLTEVPMEVVDIITDKTGIVEMVTRPYNGSHQGATPALPEVPHEWIVEYFTEQEQNQQQPSALTFTMEIPKPLEPQEMDSIATKNQPNKDNTGSHHSQQQQVKPQSPSGTIPGEQQVNQQSQEQKIEEAETVGSFEGNLNVEAQNNSGFVNVDLVTDSIAVSSEESTTPDYKFSFVIPMNHEKEPTGTKDESNINTGINQDNQSPQVIDQPPHQPIPGEQQSGQENDESGGNIYYAGNEINPELLQTSAQPTATTAGLPWWTTLVSDFYKNKTTVENTTGFINIVDVVTDSTGVVEIVTDNVNENGSRITDFNVNKSWLAAYFQKLGYEVNLQEQFSSNASTTPEKITSDVLQTTESVGLSYESQPSVQNSTGFIKIVDVVTDSTGVVDIVTDKVNGSSAGNSQVNVNETWLASYLQKIGYTVNFVPSTETETTESPEVSTVTEQMAIVDIVTDATGIIALVTAPASSINKNYSGPSINQTWLEAYVHDLNQELQNGDKHPPSTTPVPMPSTLIRTTPQTTEFNTTEHRLDVMEIVEVITDNTGVIEVVTQPYQGTGNISQELLSVNETWLAVYYHQKLSNENSALGEKTSTGETTAQNEIETDSTNHGFLVKSGQKEAAETFYTDGTQSLESTIVTESSNLMQILTGKFPTTEKAIVEEDSTPTSNSETIREEGIESDSFTLKENAMKATTKFQEIFLEASSSKPKTTSGTTTQSSSKTSAGPFLSTASEANQNYLQPIRNEFGELDHDAIVDSIYGDYNSVEDAIEGDKEETPDEYLLFDFYEGGEEPPLTTKKSPVSLQSEEVKQSAEEVEELTEGTKNPTKEVEEFTEGNEQSTQEVTQYTKQPTEEVEELTESNAQSIQEIEQVTQYTKQPSEEVEELTEGDKQSFEEVTQGTTQSTEEVGVLTEGNKQSTENFEELTEGDIQSTDESEELTEGNKQSTKEVEKVTQESKQTTEEVEEVTKDTNQSTEEVDHLSDDIKQSIEEVEQSTEEVKQSTITEEVKQSTITEEVKQSTEEVTPPTEEVKQSTKVDGQLTEEESTVTNVLTTEEKIHTEVDDSESSPMTFEATSTTGTSNEYPSTSTTRANEVITEVPQENESSQGEEDPEQVHPPEGLADELEVAEEIATSPTPEDRTSPTEKPYTSTEYSSVETTTEVLSEVTPLSIEAPQEVEEAAFEDGPDEPSTQASAVPTTDTAEGSSPTTEEVEVTLHTTKASTPQETAKPEKVPMSSVLPPKNCGIRGLEMRPKSLQPSIGRIVNGDVTSTVVWCWMAAFIHKERELPKDFICTGTLIEKDLVVTTASCLDRLFEEGLKKFKVILGDSNLQRELNVGVQERDIDEVIVHEDFKFYENANINDIGIVKLKKKVELSSTVCLLCLPGEQDVAVTKKCTATGYGRHTLPSASWSGYLRELEVGVLRQAIVPVMNAHTCRRAIYNASRMAMVSNHPSMLCAGHNNGKTTCVESLDSGSPLACEWSGRYYLTGLLSWNVECLNQQAPSVYTRIQVFTTWIRKNYMRMLGFIVE